MELQVVWSLALMTIVVPTSALWGNLEKEYIAGREHVGALVHLMEWAYTDIEKECNSLDWNGFYGIIISPPVEHVYIRSNPGWTERYMPISLTKFETRSGTEEELKNMMRQCYGWNRLRIFVDLNLNNMLQSTDHDVYGYANTKANPSEYKYEGIGKEQFHESCPLTKDDMQDIKKVRECEVEGMQDLDNSNELLKEKHVNLINRLIDMDVYGFRIVLARHMDPNHLRDIYKILKQKNSNVQFIIHDVNDLDNCVVKAKDYTQIGMVTDYEYGTEVSKYFLGQGDRDLTKLLTWGGVKLNGKLPDRNKEPLVFLYNHITQTKREGIVKPEHGKAYKMALAFMMAFPYGIPMVLSSYEGEITPTNPSGTMMSPRPRSVDDKEYYYNCINKFNCEHRVESTINMALFKAEVKERKLSYLASNKDEHWVAFAREERAFIFINAGPKDKTKKFKNLPLKPGEYCDLATGYIIDYGIRCSGKVIVVDNDRTATITLKADDPNGYVAIMTRAWINPILKQAAAKAETNPDIHYFLSLGGRVGVGLGRAAAESAERVNKVINTPGYTKEDFLEALMGKEGASMAVQAASFLVSGAKALGSMYVQQIKGGAKTAASQQKTHQHIEAQQNKKPPTKATPPTSTGPAATVEKKPKDEEQEGHVSSEDGTG